MLIHSTEKTLFRKKKDEPEEERDAPQNQRPAKGLGERLEEGKERLQEPALRSRLYHRF